MNIDEYIDKHTKVNSSDEEYQVCNWLRESKNYRNQKQKQKDNRYVITLGFLNIALIAAIVYTFETVIIDIITKTSSDVVLYIIIGFICIVMMLLINNMDTFKNVIDKIKFNS